MGVGYIEGCGSCQSKMMVFKGIVNPTDIHGSWEPDYSSSHFPKFFNLEQSYLIQCSMYRTEPGNTFA